MANGKYIALALLLASGLVFGFPTNASAYPDEGHHRHRDINPREIDAKLHVVNDTDYDMYIVVSGRNMGKLDSHSSRDFWTKCGSQYVEAEIGDSRTGKDVDISPHERRAEVTFSKSNFGRLPEINDHR